MPIRNCHHVPKSDDKNVILAAVVAEATRRYQRKCWWADPADLKQQAWVTALEAAATFKPERGKLYWYVWRAVVIQLRNHLWRESAPVTAPQRKLSELAGAVRAKVGDAFTETVEHGAGEALDLVRLRDAVRIRVRDLDPALVVKALDEEDPRALLMLARRAAKARTMRRLHTML